MRQFLVAACLLGTAAAQQAGHLVREAPPSMPLKYCTKARGCVEEQAPVVLDANWRWTHQAGGWKNCFTKKKWNADFCPDPETCAAGCAVEGVDAEGYLNTYGVRPTAGGVELKFVSQGGNVGSRLYLMEGDRYKMFKLKNREFTFDVDVAQLACGLNGAVYFVEMDPNGDMNVGNNKAGAKFGTGYCDAQCPHDIKWTKGAGNVDWKYGMCCAEMDIWEANRRASAYTPHTCSVNGAYRCEGVACGDTLKGERYMGVCDKDGCDFNPYRMGVRTFYGAGSNFKVDTMKPMTVVTQFLTKDGTDAGDLSEIRRVYVQDGKVIALANSTIPGVTGDSITDKFCVAQKNAFSDPNVFGQKGGMTEMGKVMDRGMVLALSLWDDELTEMRWLDSTYPVDDSPDRPGVTRGPCDGTTSSPTYVRKAYASATVRYMNIKYGEIGTTISHGGRRLGTVLV